MSVSGVLDKLDVSKSGYYEWLNRKASNRERRRMDMQQEIMSIYEESNKIYGAPKITETLHSNGIGISERTVGRYMKEMGIRAWYRGPYIVTTISKNFTDKLKNILDRNFSPEEPDCVWCTDITYVHTEEGFYYLSCIMDLFSRKIIAWELGKTLETEYVTKAINKAIERTGKKPKVIHTDRGTQYTSEEYENITNGIERSYSDNSCINKERMVMEI